uniref:Uncharacterized protein n=1 Tax=Anguilla anguilla TaxID=7936 RepID=A0A0E9VWU1_ANGAN
MGELREFFVESITVIHTMTKTSEQTICTSTF